MLVRLFCFSAASMIVLPFAVAATPADGAKASERCEAEVAETVKRMRGRDAREVQFVGSKRTLAATSDDETGVTGEGRYATPGGDSVPFSYSCAFNAKTGATSGVVFRETGGGAPARVPQPDLTHISPEACESATAAALKDKYPFVNRIQFGSDTRQLQATSATQVSLEGEGALQRAPGMNAIGFKYRCQIDARSGRVTGVQTSD